TKTALFHEGSVGPYIESVETIIDLKDIKEIKTKRSMGLIPNVIKIITHNNDIFKFSVVKREDWITAINKMRKELYAPRSEERRVGKESRGGMAWHHRMNIRNRV